MHAPRHVLPPAHMHTRTHTWPLDPEVPGTPRSPGSSGPACARLPSHGRCLLRLLGVLRGAGPGTAGLRFTGRPGDSAPCPAARERPGEAAGGRPAGRSGSEDSGGLPTPPLSPEPDFCTLFSWSWRAVCGGGSDPASQGLVRRHHCPSVPCVLCQACPGRHHQHLPPPSPAGVLPAPPPPGQGCSLSPWREEL